VDYEVDYEVGVRFRAARPTPVRSNTLHEPDERSARFRKKIYRPMPLLLPHGRVRARLSSTC